MTYGGAKRKVWHLRATGGLLFTLFGLVAAFSMLKFLYLEIDDGTAMGGALARPFKLMVTAIYDETRWIPLVWQYAPVPDFRALASSATVWFFVCYFGIFVGAAVFRQGSALARRLRILEQQAEDELIRKSIGEHPRRSKQDVLHSLGADAVSEPSIWDRRVELFVAPLVVTLVGAALIKLLGLA